MDRDVFEAAQMRRQAQAGMRGSNKSIPVLSVVDDGALKGFVPLHKDWTGVNGETILNASQSVLTEGQGMNDESEIVRPLGKQLNMDGFQEISGLSYRMRDKPYLRIRGGRMRFSAYCLQKFRDVEYVELLLNPIEKCIAVRPTDRRNPNAIHWGKLKNNRWAVLSASCSGLLQVLGDIMDWDDPDALSFVGEYIEEQKLLLFSLGNSVIKRAKVPDSPDNSDTAKNGEDANNESQTVILYSPDAGSTLDIPITSMAAVSLLERRHYAGDWDVLRPAKKLEQEDILSEERLAELMREAETIIEGWSKNHDEQ